MAWLIGVDEAGYGPNLGPLVVAASAWRVPDTADAPRTELYRVLDRAVTAVVDRSRIAIADSKQLYKPGGGLAVLEESVHACCADTPPPHGYLSLVASLKADPEGAAGALPWHQAWDLPLPTDGCRQTITQRSQNLRACCDAAQILGPVVQARMVFPAEFNRLVERYGTKGAALSHVTLGLVQNLIARTGTPAYCTLDKHGGRNRYGALLQHWFPDHWVETLLESRPESRYQCGENLSFTFRSQAERYLPTALASMTAKYLRELSMRAFNQFWSNHLPGLKPTAGYPLDAKRFKTQIENKQRELAIPDDLLWRVR